MKSRVWRHEEQTSDRTEPNRTCWTLFEMAQSHTKSGIEILALERQMQRINYKHKPHCVRAFLRYQLQNASPKATCCCGCWLWPSLSLVFYWIHTHVYIKFKRLTPIGSLDEVSRNNVLVQHTARYIIYGFCAWFSELPVLMKQFVSHQWTKLLCLGVKKNHNFIFSPNIFPYINGEKSIVHLSGSEKIRTI